MTVLGPEWKLDGEGIPRREGARVVVFDAEGRVLMIRGHDAFNPASSWWFTVGGGLEEGEEPREGAARELREETGLIIPPEDLVGPVMHRNADFRFMDVRARQDEMFYLGYLGPRHHRVTTEGFTDIEKMTLDEIRWFTVEELETLSKSERIYPAVLPALIKQWVRGWDGSITYIDDITYADPDRPPTTRQR